MRKSKPSLNLLSSIKLFALANILTNHQSNANIFASGLQFVQYYNNPVTGTNGIINSYGVSLAGGADLLIQGGSPFSAAEQLTVIFDAQWPITGTFSAPHPTQDMSYKSDTINAKLMYTTPDFSWLLGTTMSSLIEAEAVQFNIGILDPAVQDEAHGDPVLYGSDPSCSVRASRGFTPILYYINPRAVYYGAEVDYYVDPKSTANLVATDDPFPFTEARINGELADFGLYNGPTSTLSGYNLNQIRGQAFKMETTSNATVTFKTRAGYAIHDILASVCSTDNKTCYKAKVLPSISGISASSGYQSGSQVLTINGNGLGGTSASVTIDGVACAVQYRGDSFIQCLTGAQPTINTDQYQIGGPGLLRQFINGTNSLTATPSWSVISTSFELTQNVQPSASANLLTGYFKAPETANYRFMMTCDDGCSLYLSTDKDPSNKQQIINGPYTPYRGYWQYSDNTRVSSNQTLTAGQYYYIEARHQQNGGGDHLTVSVQIDTPTTVTNHIQSLKEIQRLQINPTNVREVQQLVITNPDSKNIGIKIAVPSSTNVWPSSTTYTYFPANSNAAQVQNALSGFWNQYYGASISVTLATSGNVNTFTITINRAVSAQTIQMNPQWDMSTGTAATVQWNLPSAAGSQISSAPLRGSFAIQCTQNNGTVSTTKDLSYSTPFWNVITAIENTCNQYKDKLQGWNGPTYNTRFNDDGLDYYFMFRGYNADPAQLRIVSSTAAPLTGGSGTVALSSTTTQAYSSATLVYEPIPVEMLYSNWGQTQVRVTVDSQEAVCAGKACSFSYVPTNGGVTSFSYSGTTLSYTGTNLADSNLVSFANQNCTNVATTSQTSGTAKCTNPTAGTWNIIVIDANGQLTSSAATVVVPLVVSSLAKSTGLNVMGGNTLIITGTGFPASLTENSVVSITLSDGAKCTLIATTSTQMQCITTKFTGSSTSSVLTIKVNGQQDTSQTISFLAQGLSLTATPIIKVSPVLAQNLVINFNPSYTGTLVEADLTASITLTTNTSYNLVLNVLKADNTAKTVTLRYNGAQPGTYTLNLKSAANGFFDTSAISIQAVGTITSFSPNSGSIYGGTLLTINGEVFSNANFTDNPVQVGYTNCIVQSTSTNQITCRLQPKLATDGNQEDVIVFLRTFYEATCTSASGLCQFNWIDETTPKFPALTSYAVTFDGSKYILTLTGTDFDGGSGSIATTDVTFLIDGTKQVVTAASTTSITLTLSSIQDYATKNIQFYLPVGTPYGASQLTTTGLTGLNPVITKLSTNTGQTGGSIIYAQVEGATATTPGLQLVTASGTKLCSSISVTSYAVVKCTISAGTIAATTIGVTYTGASATSQCSTSSQCAFQTSTTSPAVTAVTLSGNTIVFTGTNFFTSGYTNAASFAGVSADTVTVDSTGTSATATWTNGVPVVATAQVPILSFVSSAATHFASNTVTLARAPTATSIVSAVSCSFAGGCSFAIAQDGLTAAVQNQIAQVQVCSSVATLDTTQSTASQAVFKLPPLSTTYSVTKFNIQQPQVIYGTPFSSSSSAATTNAPFDGNNLNGFTQASGSSECYFGTGFPTLYVGQVSQVKFWMNPFTLATYADILNIQGSSDKSTWTTIITVGQEIHEGWNYYTLPTVAKYRYYRFQAASPGTACNIGEVQFLGVVAIDSSSTTYSCTSTINIGTASYSLTGQATYKDSSTALLTSITPRYGKVTGGDSVTFTGSQLSSTISDYTITLDGVNCPVTAATSTSVTCTTGKRPGYIPTSTVLYIAGSGLVATNGLTFKYVNAWSDAVTWGGSGQPMDGNSVSIPVGLNLLVDVDSTPVLNAVIVEGSLIFAPNPTNTTHLRTFDASYIMVRGGYFEAGTEQFPYTSQLVITMHGSRTDAKLPMYGNKVIACYQCTLDLHGPIRTPTWTELAKTALAGDTTITLNTAVDWKAGEVIAIAPTSYSINETESATILSVDNTNINNPVITLTKSLTYTHFSDIQTFNGTDFIEMRAEVALITRNVVVQGDSNSQTDQFGCHIMLSSPGDESLTGRIGYIEVRQAGQAYLLGRYPIHFHMIGNAANSYVQGNSIHNTYNRAVTAHHVNYLRIMNNVAWHTMGHTFFIEDAIEQHNYYYKNLAMEIYASWSLLNTDTTPAGFWITNQNNIFIGNHAVGSQRYGFWFDSKPAPTGPSAPASGTANTLCPEHQQLGAFINNTAHSNNKYGLRVFHMLVPMTYSCAAVVYDANYLASGKSDPYWQNPFIPALFINFTGWMNEEDNAIFEQMGAAQFINFKVADALLGNLEISFVSPVVQSDGLVIVKNALVIGQSKNANDLTKSNDIRGIITTRSEWLTIQGAAFYNFPDNNGLNAAFGTCSHCFHAAATDSGARTITTSGIRFDWPTVGRAIIYQIPYRDIFHDLDGSFTGLGPNTWATPFFQHNLQPECTYNNSYYNGLICNNQVQVRRIAFSGNTPDLIFNGMELHILPYDASAVGALNSTQLQAYQLNKTNYGIVPYKEKQDPSHGWAVPFVTGHKYRMNWGFAPLDWMQLNAQQSVRWETTDKPVYIIMNFTDQRQQINVTAQLSPSHLNVLVPNNTLGACTLNPDGTEKTCPYWNSDTAWLSDSTLLTGYNIIRNDTATRESHVFFNGKNGSSTNLQFSAARCVGSCLTKIDQIPVSTTQVLWSDPNSWASGKVPVKGDNITIPPGVNMTYDLDSSPIVSYLEINGALTFLDKKTADGSPRTLNAKDIFVREGQLIIGPDYQPYQNKAMIKLYGDPLDQHIVFQNSIEAGNKILTNTGLISMHGIQRQQMTRLTKEAQPGDSIIFVETNLDWVPGDRIALAPTAMTYTDDDYTTVQTYNPSTGIATIFPALKAYHYGAATSSVSQYGFDIRGEVLLLTRNIQIVGDTSTNSWGCTILHSDFNDFGVERNAITIMDSVEIYNCSQFDTMKASIRFDRGVKGYATITNCSIYQGWGMGVTIYKSDNIFFQNTNIYSFIRFGLYMENSFNITFDRNALVGVWTRGLKEMDEFVDISGGFIACGRDPTDQCSYSFTNNIAAGTYYSGYVIHGHDCNDYSKNVFFNNIAHSSQGTGAIIFPDVLSATQSTCMEGSYFYAYKTQWAGAVSTFAVVTQQYQHMRFLDNAIGPVINGGLAADEINAKMNNITFYGESPARDCPKQNWCTQRGGPGCVDRQSFWAPTFVESAKVPMPTMAFDIPLQTTMSTGAWGGSTYMTNLYFNDFQELTTWCGNKQIIFNINPTAPDITPYIKIKTVQFNNVAQDAMAYLYPPPWGWANPDDCGNWPCSAPNNTFFSFFDVTFTGTTLPGVVKDSTFQIVPLNSQAVQGFANCKQVFLWHAYYCTNPDIGILLFESIDSDNRKRTITPISVSNTQFTSITTVNTMMDHVWDGFYTGQVRQSRWPALVALTKNDGLTISYTGTPPNSQRFKLLTDSQYGAVISIQYPIAGTYQLYDKSGALIAPNKWNNALKKLDPVSSDLGTPCGQNTYTGVVDILQFYIAPGCLLQVGSLDSIQAQIRLQWTMDQFYADGGTTTFADRMSSSLGISSADIRVVAVYQGSVVLVFNVVQLSRQATRAYSSITELKQVLTEQIVSGSINLGAPVLSSSLNTMPLTLQPQGYNYGGNGTVVNPKPVTPTNPNVTQQNRTNNGSGNNQTVIVITTNGTEVVVQTTTTVQVSNLTIIIILAVLAGVIIIGGILGFVIYKRCSKNNKGHAIQPSEFTTQLGAKSMGNSPEMATEIQYHPKAEIGAIFGSPDQTYKTNNADVTDINDVSHMTQVKMVGVAESPDNVIHTNQHNFAEGDQLNQLNLNSNRVVGVKNSMRNQHSQ